MGRPTTYSIGDKFGGLTVLKILPSLKSGSHVKLQCLCGYCGIIKIVNGATLRKRKSCGCQQKNSKIWKSAGPKTMPWQLESGRAARNNLEHQYKKSAQKRNLKYQLTEQDFDELVTSSCVYCGDVLTNVKKGQGKTSGDFYYTGIDRIDNNIGYIKTNCVSCCWKCNNMKWKYGRDEFLKHIEKIHLHQNKQNNIRIIGEFVISATDERE